MLHLPEQWRRYAWFAATVAIAGLSYLMFFRGTGNGHPDFDTNPVTRGDIRQSVSSSGTISPLITVPVGSQVSGQLTEIDVDFNTKVKTGLTEAVLLCLAGGLIGLLLGVAITVAISWLAGWTVSIGAGTVAMAIMAAAAVGIIFGFVPARRAAGLNPIDALRYE